MSTATDPGRRSTLPAGALLPLLYLASPALPVGGFAWSQGLAPACAAGLVRDAASLRDWILNVLRFGLETFDLPLLQRCCEAAERGEAAAFFHWNALLFAGRESAELWQEEEQMGKALCRLLREQGLMPAWMEEKNCGYVSAFALGAVSLTARLGQRHSAGETSCAFVWNWLENQAVSACKCLPLGQNATQHILLDIIPHIQNVLERAALKNDDEVGACLPALAIASSGHERQHGRLFRS